MIFPTVKSYPSRDLKQLLPTMLVEVEAALKECAKRGIKVFPTNTYRSPVYQHHLYEEGDSDLDSGYSMHEFRLAIDLATDVIINGKKVLYHIPTLEAAAAVFKARGHFVWGGDWKIKDRPHFQFVTLVEQSKIRTLKTPDAIEKYLKARKK